MKLAMTLLARDEADIVDAQIAFHLNAGVDVVVATDNRSEDGTTEILERYAREGHLHLIREPGDDLRQTEWVTRMARLAAVELGADWIFNSDADEFWWPRGGDFRALFASIPSYFGVIRGAWRTFLPRPDDDRFFAERMTARSSRPAFRAHPLSVHFKSAHRAAPDVRVGRGNHEAFAPGLVPLRGWHPIEILHFPVRSYEQCRHKYVTQFIALEKNAEKGIADHMAEAHRLYEAGRLEEFYGPLVVDDDQLAAGLAAGELVVDTRLRDVLRRLGFGEAGAARGDTATSSDPRSSIEDVAAFAAECAALPESDYGLALRAKAAGLEARLGALESRFAFRMGRKLRSGLRR